MIILTLQLISIAQSVKTQNFQGCITAVHVENVNIKWIIIASGLKLASGTVITNVFIFFASI